jgi:hypothetical protein
MGSPYAFDPDIAQQYGVDEAIMVRSFQYWIEMNASNNRNRHDDKTWTYNTISALKKGFPFWSEKQVGRIVKSLISQGILVIGNYNAHRYDRTTWYAFSNEEQWLQATVLNNSPNGKVTDSLSSPSGKQVDTKRGLAKPEKVTTIPITKPVTNTVKEKRGRFTPPTLEEVRAVIVENQYPFMAEEFVLYYEQKDWMVGKTKMKYFKKALALWNIRERKKANGNNKQQTSGELDWASTNF